MPLVSQNKYLRTLLFASISLLTAFLPVGTNPTIYASSGSSSPPSGIAGSSFSVFTQHEGLAGNVVTSLGVAKNDVLWVGTTRGVTRIDGARWTTFTHLHGLGDDWITSLAIAPDNRVWFGTLGGGISVFDGAGFATLDTSNSAIPNNFVTALIVNPQGTVWLGTLSAGAASYDPSAKRWKRFSLPNNSVSAMAIDPGGFPWAGTDGGGAFRFDGTTWNLVDIPGSGQIKKIEKTSNEGLVITTADGRFHLDGQEWVKEANPLAIVQAASALSIQSDQVSDIVNDEEGRSYFATPVGLAIAAPIPDEIPKAPHPLPVVLVHGWTVGANDDIQDSEFRFLQQYASEDGIPVYYAAGISPQNTLFQNAARLRDDIAQVRRTTGAEKVNLLGFSMGGLNARAYLESSYYQDDVNRVIILGTPEAGVDIWKPILAQQLIQKPDEPSAIELTPEYSILFNQTHAARPGVPYDLLIGDARNQTGLDFLQDLPPNDGLIGVGSALSLQGKGVRHSVDEDLHAFDPSAIPIHLTSYLYPRDTYDRYLRNALRDPTNAPIGSEIESSPQGGTSPPKSASSGTGAKEPSTNIGERNHTPVVMEPLLAGQTVTRTLVLDSNNHARFLAYFPGGDVDFSIKSPDGQVFDSASADVLPQASNSTRQGPISLKADIASFVGYSISDAKPGVWSMILARKDKGSQPLKVTTYVDLDSAQSLNAQINRDEIDLGQAATITANLTTREPAVSIRARIGLPGTQNGNPFSFTDIQLNDDGIGNYSGGFVPPRSGYYLVLVRASSPTFSRERELLFAVNPGDASLSRSAAVSVTHNDSGAISGLVFGEDIEAQRAGAFAIGANLKDANGQTVARFVTPVNLSIGANKVQIIFKASDLVAPPPYSLDLTLLDASWAAIQVDGAENVATVER